MSGQKIIQGLREAIEMTDTRELVELDNYLRDPSVGLPWEVRIKIANTITALSERNMVLEEALWPFAFFDNSDPNDSTQKAWEQVFQGRVQDWIEYEEIDRARAALTSGGRG